MPDANPRIPFALSGSTQALPPFRGKRVIVHVAVNVEHWPFDQPMPRAILPAPHGTKPIPDVPNFTWVEYGLRVGMQRILDLSAEFGLRFGALCNASICTHYTPLAEAMLKADWEFVGHGLYQKSLATFENDAEIVEQSLDVMRRFSGQPVRAWLGPGLGEKPDTPEVLRRNGIRYLHDWLLDDEPLWMRTADGPMVSLPYTVELNDVPVFLLANQDSDALSRRARTTLACFARTGFERTRVMTLALHPHIIGVPHRFEPFRDLISELAAHPQVAFATSSEIGEWFEAACPAP
jgi:peptidoglycan/xylan/chitin deacetylase (PgdA/CDA1 family)